MNPLVQLICTIPIYFNTTICSLYCSLDPPSYTYENLVIQPFTVNKRICPIDPNRDTIFQAYTRNNPDNPTILRTGDVAAVAKSNLTNSNCLVVFFHGFMASSNSPNSQKLKNAILNTTDCDVILVDNEKLLAAFDYFTACANIEPIAEFSAAFMDNLLIQIGPKSLYFVGTSIGGHIAGLTSRKMTNGTVQILYGEDVAGPILDFLPQSQRIGKGDAKFVVIIHSNMFVFGSFRLAGDVDIFINNGIVQFNCFDQPLSTPLPKLILCSHLTSIAIFNTAILQPDRYPMTKCNSYIEPIIGPCSIQSNVLFGDFFSESSPLLSLSGIMRISTTDTILST
ncbi:lipase member H-like [Diabrotica undecimpunctata]|uniref:lipase member H-like n=1 Tax=Diabrotica undecimpunctata TaxID=50387 RepID=UPI003B63F0D9